MGMVIVLVVWLWYRGIKIFFVWISSSWGVGQYVIKNAVTKNLSSIIVYLLILVGIVMLSLMVLMVLLIVSSLVVLMLVLVVSRLYCRLLVVVQVAKVSFLLGSWAKLGKRYNGRARLKCLLKGSLADYPRVRLGWIA